MIVLPSPGSSHSSPPRTRCDAGLSTPSPPQAIADEQRRKIYNGTKRALLMETASVARTTLRMAYPEKAAAVAQIQKLREVRLWRACVCLGWGNRMLHSDCHAARAGCET